MFESLVKSQAKSPLKVSQINDLWDTTLDTFSDDENEQETGFDSSWLTEGMPTYPTYNSAQRSSQKKRMSIFSRFRSKSKRNRKHQKAGSVVSAPQTKFQTQLGPFDEEDHEASSNSNSNHNSNLTSNNASSLRSSLLPSRQQQPFLHKKKVLWGEVDLIGDEDELSFGEESSSSSPTISSTSSLEITPEQLTLHLEKYKQMLSDDETIDSAAIFELMEQDSNLRQTHIVAFREGCQAIEHKLQKLQHRLGDKDKQLRQKNVLSSFTAAASITKVKNEFEEKIQRLEAQLQEKEQLLLDKEKQLRRSTVASSFVKAAAVAKTHAAVKKDVESKEKELEVKEAMLHEKEQNLVKERNQVMTISQLAKDTTSDTNKDANHGSPDGTPDGSSGDTKSQQSQSSRSLPQTQPKSTQSHPDTGTAKRPPPQDKINPRSQFKDSKSNKSLRFLSIRELFGSDNLTPEQKKITERLYKAEKAKQKLEKQLEAAGIRIAEDIPYEEAKSEIARIGKRMGEIGSSQVVHEDQLVQARLRKEYFQLEQDM